MEKIITKCPTCDPGIAGRSFRLHWQGQISRWLRWITFASSRTTMIGCSRPIDGKRKRRGPPETGIQWTTKSWRKLESSQDHSSFPLAFSLQRGASCAEPAGLQPGQFVAAIGPAPTYREVLADEFAATDGEDRRAAGETRAFLRAFASRRTSEPVAVRSDAWSNPLPLVPTG